MTNYESINDEDDILGGGSFGVVHKVRRKRDLKVFACKTIVYDAKLRTESHAKREFEILARLDNPNIVRYVDAQWQSRQAKLYMEFCKEQSLRQLIEGYARRGEMVHEDYVWSIIYQLSNALSYCHHGKISPIGNSGASLEWTATILHRDIKPGNVFLSSTSETALDAIKLGDFGLGVILLHGLDPSTYAGTRNYMPPEISSANAGRNKWTSKSDIFSLGCTIYELCALAAPFEDHMESEQDEVVPISEDYSIELSDIISACISFRPGDRPDASKLLEMALTKIRDNAKYRAAFLDFQLLQAAGRGDFDQVLCLLDDGAHIEAAAGTDGEGVLHRAAKSGNEALIPFLLAKGAKISSSAHNGETPLHCAAAAGLESFVHILLDEGADVGTVDKRGWNALHTAAANNHSSVINTLLDEESVIRNIEYPTIDQKRLTPLHVAARNGCEATLQCLIDAGANIEATMADGSVALHSAAEIGHGLVLNILLQHGAKVDVTGQGKNKSSALHLAASNGHPAIADILLEKGASVDLRNVNGETPLHHAALYGHESVIKLLLARGADIQAEVNKGGKGGWTPLHLASEAGHEMAVRALLNRPLDVNARTWDGETALHWAILRGREPVARALIKHGANVHTKGPNQSTPLHWAATSGQPEMSRLLLEHEAKLEAKTSGGETALLLAAYYGRNSVVQQLIDRGASIEATNRNRETALHLASKRCRREVMRILLKNGANAKAKDGKKNTPLQIVRNNKDFSESRGEDAAIIGMLIAATNN